MDKKDFVPEMNIEIPDIKIEPKMDLKMFQAEGYLYINDDGSIGHGAFTKEINYKRNK